jgi:diguanylate cyclase (GGDEF)-like protein
VFILGDAVLARQSIRRAHVAMLALLFVLGILGSGFDIALNRGGLVWPCVAASYLCIYFFLVQSDLKIDPLTGIGNRLAFNEFLEELSHSTRTQSYYIAMLDIDHFKEINDTLGHVEGDNALRDMAVVIKDNTRRGDFIFRFGGDEFVIAVKAEHDIKRIIARIGEALDRQNSLGGRKYRLEVSYGFGVYTTNNHENIPAFIDRIDGLMYENKASKKAARA